MARCLALALFIFVEKFVTKVSGLTIKCMDKARDMKTVNLFIKEILVLMKSKVMVNFLINQIQMTNTMESAVVKASMVKAPCIKQMVISTQAFGMKIL